MIRKVLAAIIFPLAACATAPAQTEPAPVAPETPPVVEETIVSEIADKIIGMEGQTIGAYRMTPGPHGFLLEVTIEAGGLTPGWHGLHLHQVGDCSDVGVFKLSGGHMGLIPGGHGLLNPVGPESGDLTNIWAAADGSAGYEIFAPQVELSMLDDEDGTALIIHQNRDDHITQPIGGAGPRVACAVIK